MVHEIDAANQSLGRLASKIALILRGKNNPGYKPSELPKEEIRVKNAAKIKFTGDKLNQKIYYHYSGYPGGMKERKLGDLFEKSPEKILRLAVYRMLAQNRLRDKIIKKLKIER